MAIDVPATWLAEGARIEVRIPSRLVCAVCEGGGCDGCNRSGAIRLGRGSRDGADSGQDVEPRVLSVGLPKTTEGRVLLRLVHPLGEDEALAHLTLEVRAKSEPVGDAAEAAESANVAEAAMPARRLPDSTSARSIARPALDPRTVAVGVAIAVALALAFALGLR